MDTISERVRKLLEKINISEKKVKIATLQAESMDASFWQDHQAAGMKMKELSDLQKEVEELELLELWVAEGEEAEAEKLLRKLEMLLYFSGDHDASGAIFAVHSGQGGTEAMDWAEMLYRMYTRYFEKKGWGFEVIEESLGEEAGIKKYYTHRERKICLRYITARSRSTSTRETISI